MRTTLRVLGIFISAARHLAQQEDESQSLSGIHLAQRRLPKEAWALAAIKGTDDSSPGWRHLCVLGGLLIGFEGQLPGRISSSIRYTIESGIVITANLALQNHPTTSELSSNSTALILGHALDTLSAQRRSELDHAALLSAICHALFISREGLHSGYFLSTIDADIIQATHSKFDWSAKSSTYIQFQRMTQGPILNCLSPMSRMAALSIELVRDVDTLACVLRQISSFTRSLLVQWRQNKLCEIDPTEQTEYLTDLSLQKTLPSLWLTLRAVSFSVVIMLRSLLGRLLEGSGIPADMAPFMAPQILQILRDMYFVTARSSSAPFSQYVFVSLTALDIMSQYPAETEAFLQDILPKNSASMPEHPLDRYNDMFYLNTAEHFSTVLSPDASEKLLLQAAMPYLGLASDSRLAVLFEAAHSVMLAVLSARGNKELRQMHVQPYMDILFQVFPGALSPRQFRLAIRTLVDITSSPSHCACTEPRLSHTIMESVRSRVETASHIAIDRQGNSLNSPQVPLCLSEQSTYVLAMIDSLSLLPIDQLEDWLSLVAEATNCIRDSVQSELCTQRFWEVLSGGEMDPSRASLCIFWWTSRGDRKKALGDGRQSPVMSGALAENNNT